MRFFFTLLSVGALFQLLAAGEFSYRFTSNRPEAIYQIGENITFSAQLLEDGQPVSGRRVNYELVGDGGLEKKGSFISSAEKPFEISCSLAYPGGVRLLCQLPGEDGKALDVTNPATGAKNAKSVGIGAMVAPEQLRPAVPCPDDFDEFWNRQRRLLEAVPIRADRREIKLPSGLSGYADKVKAYDVKVDCAGSMPVSGRLAMPADAPPRSAPAYVSFHGAGVYSAGIRADLAAMGAIAFDVNAHGIDNGLSSEAYRKLAAGELKGYMGRNADDPEKYYYRDMYLRVLRALDYVTSLPEWDGKTLIVNGGSQGGAQAITAMALDPRVTLGVANFPALTDHPGTLATPPRQGGWPRLYRADKDGKPNDPKRFRTVQYYDGVNFAPRIHCEVYTATGFVDLSCPPTGTMVFYNELASENKHLETYPQLGHHSKAGNAAGRARISECIRNAVAEAAKLREAK